MPDGLSAVPSANAPTENSGPQFPVQNDPCAGKSKTGAKALLYNTCVKEWETLKEPLFWLTALYTMVLFALTLGRFIGGDSFAHIPSVAPLAYIVLLGIYASAKQIEKLSNGNGSTPKNGTPNGNGSTPQNGTPNGHNGSRKRGEYFAAGWAVLFFGMVAAAGFGAGNEKVIAETQEIFYAVLGIWVGSGVTSKIKLIVQTTRDVWKGTK